MDNTAEEYESKENRPGPFTPVIQTVRSITSRLAGFFKLSDVDRLKAGIYKRDEEHDE